MEPAGGVARDRSPSAPRSGLPLRLRPSRGRPYRRLRTAFLVRGAVLVDLAYLGVARQVDGRVHVSGADALTDPVLLAVASELTLRSRSWKSRTRRRVQHTVALSEQHLSERGSPADLPSGSGPDQPARSLSAGSDRLRAHVHSILMGDEPMERIDQDDAVLAVLRPSASPLSPQRLIGSATGRAIAPSPDGLVRATPASR